MLLNGYVDQVMSLLLENLDLKIDDYNPEFDPVRKKGIHEWTIPDSKVSELKKLYEIHLKQRKTLDDEQKKRKIDDKSEVVPIKKSDIKIEKSENDTDKKTVDSNLDNDNNEKYGDEDGGS